MILMGLSKLHFLSFTINGTPNMIPHRPFSEYNSFMYIAYKSIHEWTRATEDM